MAIGRTLADRPAASLVTFIDELRQEQDGSIVSPYPALQKPEHRGRRPPIAPQPAFPPSPRAGPLQHRMNRLLFRKAKAISPSVTSCLNSCADRAVGGPSGPVECRHAA